MQVAAETLSSPLCTNIEMQFPYKFLSHGVFEMYIT